MSGKTTKKLAKQALLMGLDETFALVSQTARSLQSEGVPLPSPSSSAAPGAGLVEKLPAWVARIGLLIDGKDTWLYCEPHPGMEPSTLGQILVHIAAGRYLVDTFDAASHTCIARESAPGGPLVVGLAFVGRPILLWIRPTDSPRREARALRRVKMVDGKDRSFRGARDRDR